MFFCIASGIILATFQNKVLCRSNDFMCIIARRMFSGLVQVPEEDRFDTDIDTLINKMLERTDSTGVFVTLVD